MLSAVWRSAPTAIVWSRRASIATSAYGTRGPSGQGKLGRTSAPGAVTRWASPVWPSVGMAGWPRAMPKIAAHPQSAFTQIFDWNELRGFYRVCAQKQATLPAVMQPHWQQTRQALEQQPLALIVHDTTELDFTTHPHLVGAGPIGDGGGRGFLQHNSLAVVPQPRHVLR